MPIRAAGIMFVDPQGTALFLKRGPDGDYPGSWCFPGGTVEGDESAEDTAKREAIEEIGFLPEGARTAWARRVAVNLPAGVTPLPAGTPTIAAPPSLSEEPVDFTTFLQRVKEKFEPKLNSEHAGYAWAPADAPPEPLHPGCRIALAKLTMDELGIAQAMAAGELTSPQRYKNVTLFDLRITGTGLAYRRKINEWVYRRPENYLTTDFLARCNGLPVVMLHPAKNVLDSKEFSDRIVGTMLLPYLGDGARHPADEVWGVAKVYDAQAIEHMETMPLSTSPGVVLGTGADDVKVRREDGSTLLIEGKPSLLDHLAICERGVWDKGGEPTGVNSEIRGDTDMPTPEELQAKKDADELEAKKKADAEEAEKRAKADADAGTKLDKLLECMDSLTKRMDSYDEKEKAKADAEAKVKADAEEAARKKGDPEQIAADKAKKDAEEKDEKEKADKARKDADEKVKADSEEVRKLLADLAGRIPKQMSDADYASMADAQARADSVFHAFGERAPRPLDGENLLGYRRRLVTGLKTHSKAWGKVDLGPLPDPAFEIAEAQIYGDAMDAALRPTNLPDGSLRAITRKNDSGHTVTTFVGQSTFVAGLKRPSRQVLHIGTTARH